MCIDDGIAMGIWKVGDSEHSEMNEEGHEEICSVTWSADVCTARACTAMGGFRSVHEGMLRMEVSVIARVRVTSVWLVGFAGHG